MILSINPFMENNGHVYYLNRIERWATFLK